MSTLTIAAFVVFLVALTVASLSIPVALLLAVRDDRKRERARRAAEVQRPQREPGDPL